MRMRLLSLTGGAALLLAACSDPLSVANDNSPDVLRAYATPQGVEAIVSKVFQQLHQGQYGSSDAIWPQATVMAFESYGAVANFGMSSRGFLPRAGIDNSRGNSVFAGNFRDFDFLSRNARSAANAILALRTFQEAGVTIETKARDARARSFAWFAVGFAHGNLAMFYDSAAVITPDVIAGLGPEELPTLSGAPDVYAAALQALDSALAIAESPDATVGSNGWPIPGPWVAAPSGTGPDLDGWKRLIRSYRARFRAGFARTPAERDAVDWTAVIADATTGIASDFVVQLSPSAGWSNAYIVQAAVSPGWHQMTPFIMGMADSSGQYNAWLEQPISARFPILIQTLDKRFPAGATRAAQQAFQAPRVPAPGVYFRNRPSGEDTPGEPWGTSQYDHFRFFGIRASSNNGPFPIMTKAEIDMLAAEGYLRTGQFPQATALIDVYRTRNNLPPVSGIANLTTPVPGGAACVPHVPVGPSFNTTACGNVFEAMKWEKRMETAFTGYAQWYLDGRGWGDLAENTALQWPVPYQEMDARNQAFYPSSGGAARGTYGF